MKKDILRIYNKDSFRFIVVGVLNTVIGTTVMFAAYHCGLGYWISTALNYIVGSVFSYFANKYFTFRSTKKEKAELWRFIINIVVCYFVAYGIAKPVIIHMTSAMDMKKELVEQISMLLGMCFFVIINYCGQKYFVFKVRNSERNN